MFRIKNKKAATGRFVTTDGGSWVSPPAAVITGGDPKGPPIKFLFTEASKPFDYFLDAF